jgi:hypothetical protein
MPQRIQRKRTKGWKSPDGTIMATRPGPLGNPFKGPRAIELFREWMTITDCRDPEPEENVNGWDRGQLCVYFFRLRQMLPRIRQAEYVACFCKPENSCHVDVLLELANAPEPDRR